MNGMDTPPPQPQPEPAAPAPAPAAAPPWPGDNLVHYVTRAQRRWFGWDRA
jgi:hypothetical protein